MSRFAPSFFVCSLVLAACASAPEAPAPVSAEPQELFTYRAAVTAAPAGAASLTLRVRVPEEWPTGALRPLRACVLVGNAPFEFVLTDPPLAKDVGEGTASRSEAGGLVDMSWTTATEGGGRYRELVLESHGKPMELSLRFAAMSAAPVEAGALEKELARGTSATADGKPVAGVATRLERVR